MMELHHSILKELKIDLKTVIPTFNKYYEVPTEQKTDITSQVNYTIDADTNYFGREIFVQLLSELVEASHAPSDVADDYRKLNEMHNEVLGHYFRNLYQTLKHIDQSIMTANEKLKYSGVLRAQLSSHELAMLFLNCLDENVDNGQFRNLLCKYKMLEHLPILDADIDADEYGIMAEFTFANSTMVIADEKMLEQYLYPKSQAEDGVYSFGAFGTNPTITNIYSPSDIYEPASF